MVLLVKTHDGGAEVYWVYGLLETYELQNLRQRSDDPPG